MLARHGGHTLLVADVGLAGPTPPGLREAKVAPGSADMLAGPALTPDQVEAALAAGGRLAAELAGARLPRPGRDRDREHDHDGRAGLRAHRAPSPPSTVGRGTGMDAAGLSRKREVVAAAIARHASAGRLGARAALAAVGGLELAALAGAVLEAARRRLPVVLDGYVTSAAALAAVGIDPAAAEILIASHRSAEPGHDLVLAELGLEPLLDLRLRLGEASGALLALPIIAAAGALHRDMATFAEASVTPRP